MKRFFQWVLLTVVMALPWLHGLSYPFLYDDIGMIAENPFLEDGANAGRVLTGRTLANPHVLNGRRPAVLASYFVDRALYGLRPAGWRVTNLALHLANALLLAGLVRRLAGRRELAVLAAVLFALHPVLVEAVHAPGFRADVLCLFWSLVALHACFWATARLNPKSMLMVLSRALATLPEVARWMLFVLFLIIFVINRIIGAWLLTMWWLVSYPVVFLTAMRGVVVLAVLALALLAKETAMVWPLSAGVLMVTYPKAFPRYRVAWGLVVLSVLLAAGVFAMWATPATDLQAASSGWGGESLRWPENLWSVPALWTRTLRMLLVPWPLNVTPRFDAVAAPADGRFWLGLFWMAVCGVAAWKARRRLPTVALGLGWIAVWFLPVSNLWPLYHPVADRYLYPIVPGFALLAAWLFEQQTPGARRVGAAAVALLYAALLVWRIGQWRTPETLWTAAYFQNPHSATAATWLGLTAEERGETEAAAAFYKAATESDPRAVHAWIDWGALEGRRGNLEESERLLRTALELSPDNRTAAANLAYCLALRERREGGAAAGD